MGRPKDKRYRSHYTIEKGRRVRCKACGHSFKEGATRMRAHVERIEGQGVKICDAQQVAMEEADGGGGTLDATNNCPMSPQNNNEPTDTSQEVGDGGREMIDAATNCSMPPQNNNDPFVISQGSTAHQNIAGSSNLIGGGNEIMMDTNTLGSTAHPNIAGSSNLIGGQGTHPGARHGYLLEGGNEIMMEANTLGSRAHQNIAGSSNLIGGIFPPINRSISNQNNTWFDQIQGGNGNIDANTGNGGSTTHQNIAGPINLIGGNESPEDAAMEKGSDFEDAETEMEGYSESSEGAAMEKGSDFEDAETEMEGYSESSEDAATELRSHPEDAATELRSHPEDAATERVSSVIHSIQIDISHLKQVIRELVCEEDDIKDQLKGLEHRGENHNIRVDRWLKQVHDLKCAAGKMNFTVNQFGLFEVQSREEFAGLIEKIKKQKKQKPLVLSNEIVGESFERHVKKMCKLLKDDREFIIGIHGMGGVGKTWLVTYMENEIRRKRTFNHVFVVTVSHDCSISKLQHDIAERIGAELNGDDEGKRARSLSLALEAKGKSVLVLDDVWENIDLQKVGIPLKVNGIKLIVTSRLQHVCQNMNCSPKSIIKMLPLSREEGCDLFLHKLGHNGIPATLPDEVEKIAKSIAWECDGLPLQISEMARTMKGLNGIHCWRRTWNKLQDREMREEMEEEVLKVLRLSYDNLKEKSLQDFFLLYTLYRDDHRSDLTMKLVHNGLVNGTRTLQEMFDEIDVTLDKLEGHSLLLRDSDHIWMHGLVRNMGRLVIKEDDRYMVSYNKELRKVPDLLERTSHLEVVSLKGNGIEEIPAGTSPPCPWLRTLILSWNRIKDIPNCFFTHMNALAVLDLSYNFNLTCLPDSLSELRSLISLVLRECCALNYLPPLGELKALSRLDISHTSIKEVVGLEKLINLKWLDLSYRSCSKSIALTGSMLSGLTNLQHLDLRSYSDTVRVTEKDLEKMSKLECFSGSFEGCKNYNNYVEKFEYEGFGPKSYQLHCGPEPIQFDFSNVMENQTVSFGDCKELLTPTHFLPRDLARLKIIKNKHWQCLCNALSFDDPSPLQHIGIYECTRLESLFCSNSKCTLCTNLSKLKECYLEDLESLTVICKEDKDSSTSTRAPSSSSTGALSMLSKLSICYCHKIEKLFTPGLLGKLQNLEKLEVEYCYSLEEIFPQSNSSGGGSISLPKLTNLTLKDLPQLKTVSKATIFFGSVPEIDIDGCPKLERFPIIITQASSPASFDSSDSD